MKFAYALASGVLSTEELVREYPEWTAEKVIAKTGVVSRHVASNDETALDLAERAA